MDHFHIALSEDQLRAVSSIGLAHVGDAVYELLVRTWLCAHGKATGKDLHRAAIALVCAPEQSRRAQRILPLLTAFWWGKLVAFFGATFFLASDGVLCDMLFVKKAEPTQQNFVVMCTYILAQTLLAIGFAACP